MRVEVYWNLHKSLFSVRALSGANKGRVIAHCSRVVLDNVDLKVNEAGRLRVLAEGRKNVHAFVRGQLLYFAGQATECAGGFDLSEHFAVASHGARLSAENDLASSTGIWERFTYNPRRCGSFTVTDERLPVQSAQVADMYTDIGNPNRYPVCEGRFNLSDCR